MKLNEYTKVKRGQAAFLAAAIGVRSVMVHQWVAGLKQVPLVRCLQIEKATAGAVTRRDLRPSDWAQIWPELIHAEDATNPGGDSPASGPPIVTEIKDVSHAE